MKTILEIKNLSKNYSGLKAVDNVSFKIEKGHVYGILGPNGSGKSTTLGMVLNVVNPTSGSYEWFEGTTTNHDALKRIGAIIERPNFYPSMTAVQNLELVCKIKNIAKDKIEEKLAVVDLLARKHSPFSTYSLGMKQRLAIASALLNDPEILILDEPTNGLDPQGIRKIRDIIQDIAKSGTTILLASHLLDEVEKVCTHVIVLRQGKTLYCGAVDEMNHNHGVVHLDATNRDGLFEFLKGQPYAVSVKEEIEGFKVVLNQPVDLGKINAAAFAKNISLNKLFLKKQSLEDQFIQLTNHN
ncbi:MAG: ATP-binding cassette domain-containing protein [Nonlabens ulvanivorans]|uniref:ABC transporter ATP-binding protein n=5 Tax=Nonlabens ulvanivorans TaxID=906888 RepID=A0A084JWB7_NONUL|nr:ATP-binding cassette domain-containing protein [Nonlabens ulvanivorans]KEZ93251.1 ABC transporter ATP-binding protein [Nonlabens ulvanivorans]PRX13626.1 ABC-2 type transport system ATP-binding protein [Nonlabens ulvanivorans]